MSADFHTEREVTARKEHRCDECRECIPKGARYWKLAFVYDGSFHARKLCAVCHACLPSYLYVQHDEDCEYTLGYLIDWYTEYLGGLGISYKLSEPAPVDDKTLPMFGIENAPRVVTPKRSAETLRLCNLLRAELKLPPLVVVSP